MTKEDNLLKLLESPEVMDKGISWLAEIEKYEKAFDRIERLLDKFEKMGVLQGALRAFAMKSGFKGDILAPAVHGITPKSDSHKVLFDQLNQLSEAELQKLALKQANKKPKSKK